jgi:NADP-dependent 3-hydroxy acid dehydrogenase YdfG
MIKAIKMAQIGRGGTWMSKIEFPSFDLIGHVALVTGSSQGIGLALAEGLGGAGATVVLNG